MNKSILVLILFVLPLIPLEAQYYIPLNDNSGILTDSDTSQLNEAAHALIDSLPEIYRDSFKVFSAGIYLLTEHLDIDNSVVKNRYIMMAQTTSKYYLLIFREFDLESKRINFSVVLKLPSGWLENCFDDPIINNLYISIKSKFLSYNTLAFSPSKIIELEKEGMDFVSEKFGGVSCCIPLVRSGEACSNCLTANQVLDNLIYLGFTPLSNCEIINADTLINQMCLFSDLVLLQNNNASKRISINIIDLAEYQIKIDDIEFSLYDQLNESDISDLPSLGIITKNEIFYKTNIIDSLTNLFNNNNISIWFHIWKCPDCENNILFFKAKLHPSSQRSSERCPYDAFQNSIGGTVLKKYEYTISHRSFGPWDRFGHIPFINIAWNSFVGDNRGFSLLDNASMENKNVGNVTSRIFQFIEFNLEGLIIHNNKYSSGTKGYRNFIRKIPASKSTPEVIFQEQERTAPVRGYEELTRILNGVEIHMSMQASDPLVTPLSPGIDWFTPDIENQIDVNVYYNKNERAVHVHGSVCTKYFPAYEAFISDKCGNKIFLLTASSPCESKIGRELIPDILDYHEYFDYSIPVTENGCFNGQINTLSVNRTYNTESIDHYYMIVDWNNENYNKPPAQDCTSIPCQGCYTNSLEDLRDYFHCND